MVYATFSMEASLISECACAWVTSVMLYMVHLNVSHKILLSPQIHYQDYVG